MSFLKSIFLIARWLSLDVVAGGVIFSFAIGRVSSIELHWSIPTALGCCIWLIYTLDHLIDGNTLERDPTMDRHAFHRKYRKSIFVVFVLVASFGLRLLFFLPYQTLIYGCVLLGLVGLYFLSIWLFKIYFAKELFIAVLYTCGIFLGTLSLNPELDMVACLFFIHTALMASINLLLFSFYEVAHDAQDGHRSWATHFGVVKTLNHLFILLVTLALLIGVTFMMNISTDQLILLMIFMGMSIILTAIFIAPQWFKKKERYRWIGDLVFLLPGLIFLF